MSDSKDLRIGEYVLEEPLTTDDAGSGRWGKAMRDGRTVFLKEFLSPVYPSDDSGLSEKLIESKRKICDTFFKEKTELYDRISKCQTGNIIWADDFFRYKSRYYIATEFIESKSGTIASVKNLLDNQKRTILKLLCYNVARLHENGVVHSDIKPSNVMIKPTKNHNFTAKLIDFDSSFLEEKPPKTDADVHGDFIYLAPEAFLKMRGDDVTLNNKIDIFSLGVMFHEMWTGESLVLGDGYNYAYEAVGNNANVGILPAVPDDVASVIKLMIQKKPEDRPSAQECFFLLGGRMPSGGSISVIGREGPRGPIIDPPPPPPPEPEPPSPEPGLGSPWGIAKL